MSDKIKLLIVDDEARFLATLARRLSRRGFQVITAADGPEAVAMARQEKFDIALLDLKMPGMDGGEVLARLKAEHSFLEAIIITGHGTLESAVELTKLGAFGYLPKPYELERLVETIRQAYQARLRRKIAHDQERLERITRAAAGATALGVLRELRELDDLRR